MMMRFFVVCFAAALLAGCGYRGESQPAAPMQYRPAQQEKLLQAGYFDNGIMCYSADSPAAQ